MKRCLKWFCWLGAFVMVITSWGLPPESAEATDPPYWWQQAARQAAAEGYRLISAQDLAGLYNARAAFRIVDVRTDYEYRRGHLPGAVNLTFGPDERDRLRPAKKRLLTETLGPDKHLTVILYCRNYT